MSQHKVDVLLACYQGEKYLKPFLDSLLQQSYTAFQIIARDDCSSDRTYEILCDYQIKYPEKIQVLPSGKKLGVVGSFSDLLQKSDADYIFFADQDDVWHPEKIEDFLKKFSEHEGPLLIHSDLEVVDISLNPLHPSFWKFTQIKPEKLSQFNRLLVQNTVTGCSMAINKPLKNLLGPISHKAIFHDWWIALAAAAFGKMIPLPKAYVKYRQHGENVVGAKKMGFKKAVRKIKSHMVGDKTNLENQALVNQAHAFLNVFQTKLSQKEKEALHIFINGGSSAWFVRKWNFLKFGFFRKGFVRNVFRFCLNRPY